MIAAITEWVKSIVFVVLFATFLELLLPTNNMQKFIRIVMGLFIMLAILEPIVDLVQNHKFAEALPALSTRTGSQDITRDVQAAVEQQDKISHEIYRRDLAKQIRALVLAVEGVAEAQVTVETADDPQANKFGIIRHVAVAVKPGRPETVQVSAVAIGTQNPSKQDVPPHTVTKIKKAITELYQIHDTQIDITYMD